MHYHVQNFYSTYFLYAIEVWGHTKNSTTGLLVRLQNKILRILFNCKRSDDAWAMETL